MSILHRTIGGAVLLAAAAGLANLHRASAETATASVVARATAVCVLTPVSDSDVKGVVLFTETADGVEITAEVTGLTPGEHGFHIHEFGDCRSLDGKSAGGHFNPTEMPHGGPESSKRHVGDLGNLVADENGKAIYKRLDKVVKLSGPTSILGRAIIVHAGRDDLTTQPTGDAGGRVACGVIGVGKPVE